METLRAVFNVERLAVVGGGNINGSMLDLGLIDEVSMMYGYGIDGRGGMAAAFDGVVNLYALLSRVWKNRTASYGLGIK